MYGGATTTGHFPTPPHRFGGDEYVPLRKIGQRPIDYFSSCIHHVQTRFHPPNSPFSYHVPAHPYYTCNLLPARVTTDNPSTALCTQWVHTCDFPPEKRSGGRYFSSLAWAPNGRSLIAGTSMGEFYVLNGHSFARERATPAHAAGKVVRALSWGKTMDLILSGDGGGGVRLWLPSLVLLSEFNTYQKEVKDISFAPGEARFITAGHDGSVKLWNTDTVGTAAQMGATGSIEEELKFEGHGNEVTSAQWHPYKALIITGSKDSSARLWDPRSGAGAIAILEGHAAGVSCVRWSKDGSQFLTSSMDCTIKLWDLRHVKECVSYQVHQREVTRVAWHPTHSDLFASSSADGDICYWFVTAGDGQLRRDGVAEVVREKAVIKEAHDRYRDRVNEVKGIEWSPMGHLLTSFNYEVKFWHRGKPGTMEETNRGLEEETF